MAIADTYKITDVPRCIWNTSASKFGMFKKSWPLRTPNSPVQLSFSAARCIFLYFPNPATLPWPMFRAPARVLHVTRVSSRLFSLRRRLFPCLPQLNPPLLHKTLPPSPTLSFLFNGLPTLLQLKISQPLSLQQLPHSSAKPTRGGGTSIRPPQAKPRRIALLPALFPAVFCSLLQRCSASTLCFQEITAIFCSATGVGCPLASRPQNQYLATSIPISGEGT